MSRPLRVGILGASRIAGPAIIEPASILGHKVVTIAARDPRRAAAFATDHGVARSSASYRAVIEDPEVDLVYNGLVNSEHANWNIAALEAGKHVLTEKPSAANAEQAVRVAEASRQTSKRLFEGFHYLHHPVNLRIREAVTSGELGQLQEVGFRLQTEAPPDSDPRWSAALAGGATMDLGCYVLSAARALGRWTSGEPTVSDLSRAERSGGVDAKVRATLSYPNGLTGRAVWDMDADERVMTWRVTGSAGSITALAFAVPGMDNRVVIENADGRREERLGDQTSYTYQLAAVAEALATAGPFDSDAEDAVATMRLIDACRFGPSSF